MDQEHQRCIRSGPHLLRRHFRGRRPGQHRQPYGASRARDIGAARWPRTQPSCAADVSPEPLRDHQHRAADVGFYARPLALPAAGAAARCAVTGAAGRRPARVPAGHELAEHRASETVAQTTLARAERAPRRARRPRPRGRGLISAGPWWRRRRQTGNRDSAQALATGCFMRPACRLRVGLPSRRTWSMRTAPVIALLLVLRRHQPARRRGRQRLGGVQPQHPACRRARVCGSTATERPGAQRHRPATPARPT